MLNNESNEPLPEARCKRNLRLIIVSLLALVLLAGVGLVYYFVDWQTARTIDVSSGDYQKVYQRFLEDIEADSLDAAYQSTTASFQRQTSRDTFEKRVRHYLAFKRKFAQSIEVGSSGPAGGNYRGPNRMSFTHVWEDKDKNRMQVSVSVVQDDSIFYRRPPPPRVGEFTVEDATRESER
jgi:hypothetical protein